MYNTLTYIVKLNILPLMLNRNYSMFNKLDYYTIKDNQYICNTCKHSLKNNLEAHALSCNGKGPKRKIKSIYSDELKERYIINGKVWICKKCDLSIANKRELHSNNCDGSGKWRQFDLNKVSIQIQEGQLCSFGCGKKAKHYFKSSKNFCCSTNSATCEANKKKNSEAKKGVNPWEGKVHPRPSLGKSSWNKGLTAISDERIAQSSQKARQSLINYYKINPPKLHTQETKDKIAANINARYASGWETVCGRAKKYDYLSPIAGQIKVDGTWELTIAQILDKIGIQWQRNKKRFDYIHLNGNEATYLPDFYIPSIDTFLEIKGYQTSLDERKWEQFKPKLFVIKKAIIFEFRKWLKEDRMISEKEFLDYLDKEVIKINC